MEKDRQNDENNQNVNAQNQTNEEIDFDSMFEEDDITSWGVFEDERIAAFNMHKY